MKRKCPECNIELTYKSKPSFYRARKKNSLCKKCAQKNKKSNYEIWVNKYGKKIADQKLSIFIEKTSKRQQGKNNSFFNKKHSEKTKKHLAKINNNKRLSQETKRKISKKTIGDKNPMHGKSFYDIWVNKYGKKKADLLLKEKKKKHSLLSSGKNNPMYNKPSPCGSGNGYKGWYKNIYFRSLRELSFMIRCEEFNIRFETAEHISIEYIDYNNNNKTYRPDFIVGNTLIEIKPTRLKKSPSVLLKKEAAIRFCKNNSLRYKMIDPTIHSDMIDHHIKKNNIKFTRNYLERYKKYNENN